MPNRRKSKKKASRQTQKANKSEDTTSRSSQQTSTKNSRLTRRISTAVFGPAHPLSQALHTTLDLDNPTKPPNLKRRHLSSTGFKISSKTGSYSSPSEETPKEAENAAAFLKDADSTVLTTQLSPIPNLQERLSEYLRKQPMLLHLDNAIGDLDTNIQEIQSEIKDFETILLQETGHYGNVVTGFEEITKASSKLDSLFQGSVFPEYQIPDSERIFSKSHTE